MIDKVKIICTRNYNSTGDDSWQQQDTRVFFASKKIAPLIKQGMKMRGYEVTDEPV